MCFVVMFHRGRNVLCRSKRIDIHRTVKWGNCQYSDWLDSQDPVSGRGGDFCLYCMKTSSGSHTPSVGGSLG